MKTEEADKNEQNDPTTKRPPRTNTISIPRAYTEKAKDPENHIDQPEPDIRTHDYLLLPLPQKRVWQVSHTPKLITSLLLRRYRTRWGLEYPTCTITVTPTTTWRERLHRTNARELWRRLHNRRRLIGEPWPIDRV
jgi:hypothetical protein